MSLRGWSWDVVNGPAGLGNQPLLEALAVALPDAAIEEAIERTGAREQRRRRLPTHLVVTLLVGMGLWAEASVRHVLAAVVDGWREERERREDALTPVGPQGRASLVPLVERAAHPGSGWRLPSTAAIVKARQRVGVRLFRELFHAMAGPIATPETPGAFLGGLRLMALDGSTLDVTDTPENARAFGRPTTRRGAAGAAVNVGGAFPQLRMVALIETGTRALCDVVLRPFHGGEAPAGRHLLQSVGPGMLVLWDRGFHGYEMIRRTLAREAHFLGRTKANVVLPPETVLPDGSFLSTISPSATARRRRQDGIVVRVVEYALDTAAGPGKERYRRAVGSGDDPGRGQGPPVGASPSPAEPPPARSRARALRPVAGAPRHPHPHVPGLAPGRHRPRPLELYWCLARAAPRHPPRPAHRAQAPLPFFQRLLRELAAERLPPRRPRQNPRAVKRKMSNFARKRPPPSAAPPRPAAPASVRILRP